MSTPNDAPKRHVHFPSDENLLAAEHRAASPAISYASSVSDLGDAAPAGPERGVGTRSIVIMLCINFLANIVFSIVIPSIWPFLNDGLGVTNKSYVGWAVACNSAGTFIAAPLLGAWADKWSTRGVMAVSLFLMVLANFCYSLAYNVFFHEPPLWPNLAMLLGGRFLVGVAAGNYAVVQSYFSYATKPSQRLSVMSWNAGTTVIGFIVGPAIAAACKVDAHIGKIPINSKTLPGYLSAVAAFAALCALPFLEDVERPSAVKLAREALAQEEQAAKRASRVSAGDLESAPLLGASEDRAREKRQRGEAERKAGSVANYGAWLFGGSGYYAQPVSIRRQSGGDDAPTGGPSLHYGSSAAYDRAKTWTGAFPIASYGSFYASGTRGGAPGGDEAIEMDVFSDERTPWLAVIVCLFLNFTFTLTFTCLETIGPPYTQKDLGWGVEQNGLYFMVLGLTCIVSLIVLQFITKVLSDRVVLALTALLMAVGYAVNVPFHDHQFPPHWRFYTSSGLTSVGYAAGTAVLLAIYSKVLEGLDQGTFMGWFSAACSTARIIGPLAASYLLENDPTGRWIFGGVAIILFISFLVSVVSYQTLQPQCEREEEEEGAGKRKSIN